MIVADHLSKHFKRFSREPGLVGSLRTLFTREFELIRAVDDVRVARICRALRRRSRLSQRQLGGRAGLSQQAVSLVERGHGSRLSGVALRRLFAGLDARWDPTVSWRGGALDRLLDARHANLAGRVVELLKHEQWRVEVEVTYSSFGERGSIDVLGWWPSRR